MDPESTQALERRRRFLVRWASASCMASSIIQTGAVLAAIAEEVTSLAPCPPCSSRIRAALPDRMRCEAIL
eukprot:CAMPEP_0181320944 /NCGR_PEP_ID=MMETSP1101-20121128/18403_1 /TAXON_ID=46948 /ORGANISM="Rhodomonas abbreviata, Strain Caron Lab Isolate" /LENGTH=70 /DNA_ID=CAMNT_0023428701 /DNA_START=912 /DNA_END=1124 /DNA_ORIENTATION=+